MGHDRFYAENSFALKTVSAPYAYDNTLPVNDYLPKNSHITFGSLHTLTRLNSQVIDL